MLLAGEGKNRIQRKGQPYPEPAGYLLPEPFARVLWQFPGKTNRPVSFWNCKPDRGILSWFFLLKVFTVAWQGNRCRGRAVHFRRRRTPWKIYR
jgi:hypothetical protein